MNNDIHPWEPTPQHHEYVNCLRFAVFCCDLMQLGVTWDLARTYHFDIVLDFIYIIQVYPGGEG